MYFDLVFLFANLFASADSNYAFFVYILSVTAFDNLQLNIYQGNIGQ
jgi:hypothetical protein